MHIFVLLMTTFKPLLMENIIKLNFPTMIRKLSILLISTVILISCGSESSSVLPSGSAYEKEYSETSKEKNLENEIDSRKLIKKGSLRFETNDASESRQRIASLVTEFEGFLGTDNVNQYDDRIEYEIEARIPSANFDAFINKLTSQIDNIDYQNIDIKDVTGKYYDIEARLKSKKVLEERYLTLLKKAETVEDMLTIEKELEKVRSDIESIEGRFKQLQKQVSFSELQITFYQTIEQTSGLARKAGKAFTRGWNMLLEVVVGILNIWPFLIIIGVVLYIILRFEKRRVQKEKDEKMKE
jgi:hypothetical protein